MSFLALFSLHYAHFTVATSTLNRGNYRGFGRSIDSMSTQSSQGSLLDGMPMLSRDTVKHKGTMLLPSRSTSDKNEPVIRNSPFLPTDRPLKLVDDLEKEMQWAKMALVKFNDMPLELPIIEQKPMKYRYSRVLHHFTHGTGRHAPFRVDINDQVGKGGQGMVYGGTWFRDPKNPSDSEKVAIKFLPKEGDKTGEKHFKREVKGMLRLHSLDPEAPVCLYDVYLEHPYYWILITERGFSDMYQWMEENSKMEMVNDKQVVTKSLSESSVRGMVIRLISSLRKFNEYGFIHGDIKPENIILFRSDGKITAKLGDFGMHRSMKDKDLLSFDGHTTGYIYTMPNTKRPFARYSRKHYEAMDAYAMTLTIHNALWAPFGDPLRDALPHPMFSYKIPHQTVSKPLDRLFSEVLSSMWTKNPRTFNDLWLEISQWARADLS
ncbi:MAG: kinase-like domain-containing protein [Piptocephalis tieghemiana]|nr:MAG: kinase-like domain-containing protein [Piptocephalis tieghemiana]